LLSQKDQLSTTVETFLWTTKPHWSMSPADGPGNYTWIAGDIDTISWSVQSYIDQINALVPYDRQGFGGLEAFALSWLVLGVFGALWVWIHSVVRRPQMPQEVRLFWVLSILILSGLGLLAYFLAQKGEEPQIKSTQKTGTGVKALTGAAKMTALVTGVWIFVSLLFYVLGRPIWLLPGGLFIFGNPMFRAGILAFLITAFLGVFLIEPALTTTGAEKYRTLLKENVGFTLASVILVSLIFFSALRWLRWGYLTSPPGPTELMWPGTIAAAAIITVLLAYPLHYWIAGQNPRFAALE